eukprot:12485-Pelagococcus_subviridis.AAC.1
MGSSLTSYVPSPLLYPSESKLGGSLLSAASSSAGARESGVGSPAPLCACIAFETAAVAGSFFDDRPPAPAPPDSS